MGVNVPEAPRRELAKGTGEDIDEHVEVVRFDEPVVPAERVGRGVGS